MRSPSFSRRTSRVKASAIREILKVTERPEILSFAGGLPAPEAFPGAELARAHAEVLAREGAAAFHGALDAIPEDERLEAIDSSYDAIVAKLPKKYPPAGP